MQVLWNDIEVQSGIDSALDFFYGVTQIDKLTRALPIEFSIGHGQRAADGLFIGQRGYSTILKSGLAATIRVESADNSTSRVPDALAAAVTQQWLRLGFLPVHAAFFELNGCGLLVLGDSTSGKSTLTMAAKSVGARVISDDFIRIKLNSNGLLIGMRVRGFLREREPTGDRYHWLSPEPAEYVISAIAALQPTTKRSELNSYEKFSALSLHLELIRQSAPLFMHGFEHEAATMHRIISALTSLPHVKVKTGTEVKRAPLAALQGILRALQA